MTNDKLMSEVLKYKGKLLKTQGVRKNKETQEDIAWKLWHLLFESGRQYDWKCSCFDSLSEKSIQIKDLEEGKFYEIVYKITEYTHETHGLVKSKQAVLIKESNEDSSTEKVLGHNSNNADPAPSVQTTLKVADNWVAFANEYNESLKEGGNAMHMLGAYVFNKLPAEFESIIALCKKNFK